MMLSARIEGDGFKQIVRIAGKIDAETKKIVRATTQEAKRALVANLAAPKSGRVYEEGLGTQRYRMGRSVMARRRLERYRAKVRKGVHQASAPGQAPARLTGTLLRSIRARSTRRWRSMTSIRPPRKPMRPTPGARCRRRRPSAPSWSRWRARARRCATRPTRRVRPGGRRCC